MHAWEPGLKTFAGTQPVLHEHASIVALPTIEFEFAGHQMHSDLLSAEYLPASQSTQPTAAVPEYLPDAQPAQAWSPALALNLPGTHAVQFCFVPNQPGIHKQLAREPPSRIEYVSAGHKRHCGSPSVEYLPTTHNAHVTADVLEYLPAAQSAQA